MIRLDEIEKLLPLVPGTPVPERWTERGILSAPKLNKDLYWLIQKLKECVPFLEEYSVRIPLLFSHDNKCQCEKAKELLKEIRGEK